MRRSSAFAIGLFLSCGGCHRDGGLGRQNRAACEVYVAHMNTLQPCMNISYDADNLCSGVDGAPIDMAPYYQCLQANARCEGTQPVLNLDGCTPPTLSLGG